MGAIKPPEPVKLICGVLFNPAVNLPDVEAALAADFGPVERQSPIWPFDHTNYYDDETGPGIQRTFFAFRGLIDPGQLAAVKIRTNAMEQEFALRWPVATRPVNLDPGYVDKAKLVLATTKDCSHRIYIRDGIYAEVTLRFCDGRFEPWPWTYPDYHSAEYVEFFTAVRRGYLAERSPS